MCIETVFTAYKAWLVHREYSPATIEKYTRALRRFFADTAATPAPDRETVAAWRDALAAKGYTPATVNSMLAAVNDYQESIDNPAGKAKPLKRQRRVFCDADRELSRAEYFRLPQGIPATSARCCCCKRCALPASACRNCLISRSKLCGGTKLPSAAKGSAVKFCCQQNFATGWNVGAGAGTFMRGRYFYRARASRWAGSRSGNC